MKAYIKAFLVIAPIIFIIGFIESMLHLKLGFIAGWISGTCFFLAYDYYKKK